MLDSWCMQVFVYLEKQSEGTWQLIKKLGWRNLQRNAVLMFFLLNLIITILQSPAKNETRKFNGMLRHSLATLEGEQEFIDFYRALLSRECSPLSIIALAQKYRIHFQFESGILSSKSFSLILLLINLSLSEAMFLPILNLLVSVVRNVEFLLLKFWLKFSASQYFSLKFVRQNFTSFLIIFLVAAAHYHATFGTPY